MLVSVFTPSHRTDHLRDCWACLHAQTHSRWEWVVVANGPEAEAVAAQIGLLAGDDPRVRLLTAPFECAGIGALKRFACDHAAGDVFLEYDHDDLLTPDCLAKVVAALAGAPPAAFAYSDDVTSDFDGNGRTYDLENGWRYYTWDYLGRSYPVNRSFPADARSLCEILYAPDHVRAWTRAAYKLAGGHDPALPLGDDHHLLIKTYLKGVPFVHVPEPLYIHRVNPTNTSEARSAEIQTVSRGFRDVYLHPLVVEWCRRQGLVMLDMGGLFDCPPGYVPVDRNPRVLDHPDGIHYDVVQAAHLADPHRGLSRRGGGTIEPGTVGAIRCVDFLEHVPGPQVPRLLNWFYDLLAPGGWLLTHTPAAADADGRVGRGAFQDPTHVSHWTENNFWYFTSREYAKYLPEYRGRFQAVRLANHYPNDFCRKHAIPYVTCDLMKLVDGLHQAGINRI